MKKYLICLNALIFLLCSSCAYESQNREKLISSFEDNFGFKPPESIRKLNSRIEGILILKFIICHLLTTQKF